MKAQLVDLIKDGPFHDGDFSVAFGAVQAGLTTEQAVGQKTLIYAPNPCLLYASGNEIIIPGYSLTVVEPGTRVRICVNDLEEKVKTIVLRVPATPRLDEDQKAFLGKEYDFSRNGWNSAIQEFLGGAIMIYTDASREKVQSLREGRREKPGWFTDAAKDQSAAIAVARWKKIDAKEKMHYHNFTNESFVISKGSARFVIEDEEYKVPTGGFLHLRHGIKHKLADIGFDESGDYSHLSCQHPAVPTGVKNEKVVVEQ